MDINFNVNSLFCIKHAHSIADFNNEEKFINYVIYIREKKFVPCIMLQMGAQKNYADNIIDSLAADINKLDKLSRPLT